MTDKQQQDYMKDKIENPNSPEHKKVWKAYRKDWGRNKVKESSRPPWYARIGRHIPVPDQQTANRWGRNAALVGAGAACAAIIVSTGGAAAPLLVPAL
jgi:ferric-dicitrate binding protein FerR (iron transport regulator)